MRSITFHIKLWIWNNFINKYYKDWIQDEINDAMPYDYQDTEPCSMHGYNCCSDLD